MAKILVLLISVTLAGVLAEPPVPNSYLPPSQNGARTPDSQYGAPIIENRILSTQYGAPEAGRRFGGASARFGGALSNDYGASSASARSFGSIPSKQYGTPAPSVRNGGASRALSRFGSSGSSRSFGSSLATQYGAPTAEARNGGTSPGLGSSPSTRYGAPSASGRSFGGTLPTQYGAPSASRGSFDDKLSTQYGAPAASSRSFGAASLMLHGTPFASGRAGALLTQYGVPSANSVYAADGGYAASTRNLAREDDIAEPANYEFAYEVEDTESGAAFSQEEARQDEQAQGSYRVLLPDGRLQIVEYEADLEGYKPRIRYEDTGAGGYPRGGPQQRGGLKGPY